MVLVTAFLVDFDNRRCTWRHLLWLIPIHIVWTNLHGGMLGGVVTFAMATCVWILTRRDRPGMTVLPLIVIACGLAMFVNPIGLELQRTWFRLIGSKTLAMYVEEHSPIKFDRGGDLAVLGFAALYLIILAGAGKPKLLWLIPLAWLALSITSIRNGPLFVALAAVMLADIWPHTVWYRKLLVGGDTLATPTSPLPRVPWVIPSLAVIAGLFVSGWSRFDPKYVPVDTIEAVRNIPAGERIYNDPNLGGFLIWNAPDCKIFMDDRFELCGDDWLREYVENPQFDAWQKQYGFRWAFVGNDALADHPQWKLVQRGQTASLYQRR